MIVVVIQARRNGKSSCGGAGSLSKNVGQICQLIKKTVQWKSFTKP